MWSDPVPNDSSPQIDNLPASIKFPKNFHPNQETLISYLHSSPHTLTRRHFETFHSFLLCYQIDRLTRRHTPSQPFQPLLVLEIRYHIRPIRYNSNRIRRRHERVLPVNHIPITIPITRCTERNPFSIDYLYQRMCVREVRIGGPTTEIG